jgi:hypothetical protein
MAKTPAAKPSAVDFTIDPDTLAKAQKELDRIITQKDQEQGKAGGEK